MNDSILRTVKKVLNLDPDYTAFDADVIMHINMALMVLRQVGIGPPNGFVVTDETQTWTEFLGSSVSRLDATKSFVYLKVRLVFDPPEAGYAISAMERQIDELLWRLNTSEEEVRHPWIPPDSQQSTLEI